MENINKLKFTIFVLILLSQSFAITMTGFIAMANDDAFLPNENLIIVETTPDGLSVEKRVAKDTDLLFTRSMTVKGLVKNMKLVSYRHDFILIIKNISNRNLENITILEKIPESIETNLGNIKSDTNMVVLKENSMLRFDIKSIAKNQEINLSYYLDKENEITTDAFHELTIPFALVNLEEGGSCIGMYCNDSNPCTRDYCTEGKCKYEPLADKTACGDNKQCTEGKCLIMETTTQAEEVQPLEIKSDYLIFGIIIVALAIILVIVSRKKWFEKK